MTWAEYIRENKDNLIKSLNLRLGAVRKIKYLASFKNRKMIAEGVFMSKLSYLIALWGGCGTGLKKSLQIIQSPVDILPLSSLGLQGEAGQGSQVLAQHAQQLVLPLHHKTS